VARAKELERAAEAAERKSRLEMLKRMKGANAIRISMSNPQSTLLLV
jgi:hypothetical protein